MKVNLTMLSPVHIGASREDVFSQAVDYVLKGNNVVLVDLDELQKVLAERSLGKINLEESFINDLRQGRIQRIADFLNNNGISVDEVELACLPAHGQVRGEIRRTINSNGRIYIPGSSIKGLFRTALAYDYLKNNFTFLKNSVENVVKRQGDPRKAFAWLDKKIIFLDPHRDPLKNLLVSDTEFFSPSDIGIFATSRMYLKTFQTGPPVPVEAVAKDAETTFSLKITPLKVFKNEFLFLEDIEGWKELFKQVNAFTKVLLEREIRELSTGFTSICNQYKAFLNQLNRLENACIGRIGFGKTVFDETVTLLLEEYGELALLRKFEDYLNRNFWKRRFRGEWIPRKRSIEKGDPLPSTRLFVLDKNGNPEGVLGWVKMAIVN